MRLLLCRACLFAVAAGCGGRVANGSSPGNDHDNGTTALDGSLDAPLPSDAAHDAGSGDAGTGPVDAAPESAPVGCTPLPGCSSTTICPAADACNVCQCEGGLWQCTGYACPGDGGGENQDCPLELPSSGPCAADITCAYRTACAENVCTCASGNWSCHFQTQFCDAGPPGNACPSTEPLQGAACGLSGTACEYATCPGGVSTRYDTNCLCVSGHWDCASFASCDDGGH